MRDKERDKETERGREKEREGERKRGREKERDRGRNISDYSCNQYLQRDNYSDISQKISTHISAVITFGKPPQEGRPPVRA